MSLKKELSASQGLWLALPDSVSALHESVRDFAPGGYILFLASGVEPTKGLIQRLRTTAESNPAADVIYGEVTNGVAPSSGRTQHPRKPDWSPTRLLHENYVGDTLLVRTAFLLSVTAEAMGTSTWDSWSFLLACVRQRARVHHDGAAWIAETDEPHSVEASRTPGPQDSVRRVRHHLSLTSSRRTARPSAISRLVEIVPDVASPTPTHAFVTLTAGSADPTIGQGAPFIAQHLDALNSTSTAAAQHVIVIGQECDPAVRRDLETRRAEGVTILDVGGVFNFARRSNLGRFHTQAEFLIFTNDDFIAHNEDWVHHLLAPFDDEQVAITGATLQYEDGSLQHAGVGVIGGNFDHVHHGLQSSDAAWNEVVTINREVDAVTGACLAIRSRVFDEVGGFFEGLPLNFNDVDLCLKTRQRGYSVVLVGMPLGHHFESKTRVAVVLPEESAVLEKRWPQNARRAAYPFEPVSNIFWPKAE